ncbi:MAG: YitT family protein [Oscillospiraceae bacterium]
MLRDIKPGACAVAVFSSAFLAFGLYNVHAVSGVTEGGVLGMTLLLQHWFRISPAVTNVVLNAVCYLFGWRMLGRKFIVYSAISTGGFSLAYWIFEQFPPLWPGLYETPLAAALLGAVFVGLGAGCCVRIGGAPSGDDALAMAVSRLTGLRIEMVYLISDLTVLLLSATYIPWRRLGYSLLTVILSGQLIGLVQRIPLPGGRKKDKDTETN